MQKLWRWLKPLLIWIDQGIGLVLRVPLGWLFQTRRFGDPDETVSSVLGKEARDGNRRACWVCRMLDIVDKNHCEKSIEEDRGHA